MDEILLHENQKLSPANEAPENIESDLDGNEIYHIENISLDGIKEKLEWHRRAFYCKQENTYGIENQNDMKCVHYNEVNKISECNLLHYILNPPKITKQLNSHYYYILHGCMNTKKANQSLRTL